jgi:pSer/pThr/pTyr-binding forkhead associated (FHA) protein
LSKSSDDHNASQDDTIGHRTIDVHDEAALKAPEHAQNPSKTTEMQRSAATGVQTVPVYMGEPDVIGLESYSVPANESGARPTDEAGTLVPTQEISDAQAARPATGEGPHHAMGHATKQVTQEAKIRVASPDQVLELPRSANRSRLQLSTKPDKSQRSVIRARLVVVNPHDERVTVYLDSPDLVIGRGREAHLILMDDGASRLHARFERHEAGFRMLDLDSGNGTFVNGRRIQYSELYDGDLIAIGRTRIRFESVGWSRLPDIRTSFVQTVLTQTFQNVPRTAMWPALIMAFFVGLTAVTVMGVTGVKSRSKPSELVAQRIQQAQVLMDKSQWEAAKDEIVFASLLDAKSEKIKNLREVIDQRLAGDKKLALMTVYLRDGRTFSEINDLAQTTSSHPDVKSRADELLTEATHVQAERYYVRALRHFMAGRLEKAQSVSEKAIKMRSGHKAAQALLKSVINQREK